VWDDADVDAPSPLTQVSFDTSRSILNENDSPDVPFRWSVNPYRGCEHGCFYCYARPTHEYLGFSAGLDFETKIVAKRDAPALLAEALESPRWKPEPVALAGATDPYQPVERELRLTRGCLEVLAEYRNPLLGELAKDGAAAVALSITTLDKDLARRMEPRACQPQRRLVAIERLTAAGIPVNVLVAPVIPGLNDAEIPAIVEAARAAGARGAGMVLLRLPHGLVSLFEAWLEREVPEKKARVLARLRGARGGAMNDPRFGARMRGTGAYADQLRALFELACTRAGLSRSRAALSGDAFRRRGGPGQLLLFGPS
jgi:DNA repair photolyase